jgi:formylglycine-generating enzyme required for sulfatase activity
MKKCILLPLLGILLLAGCRNPAGHQSGGNDSAKRYSVRTAAGANGGITVKPESAPTGTEIILQISPAAGYKLRPGSLKINGPGGETIIGEGLRSFKLPAYNVLVSGEFEALAKDNYSVSVVSGTGKHGLVIASPESGPAGTELSFCVVPDEGYRYVPGSLKTKEAAIDEVTRTFILPARHISVDADFAALPSGSYTVRVNSPVNGRIIARPESGPPGSEIYLQVIARSGYALKSGSLKYQDTQGEHQINESFRTLVMPRGHILVSGEFEKVPGKSWSIGVENMANGRILAQSQYGAKGDKITLQVFPDPGFTLKPGTLKYKSSTSLTEINNVDLSFNMPEDNVIIQAEFTALQKDVFSVRVGQFQHGEITAFPGDGKKDTAIYLWVKPDTGYQLKPGTLWYTDDSGQKTQIGASQSFKLPASHVKIEAEFEPLSAHIYTVDTDHVVHGRVVARPGSGKEGDSVTLWVLPDTGYYYKKGTLKYKNIPSNAEFPVSDETRAFKLNASDARIQVEFAKHPANHFMIRAMPADHGVIYPRQDYGYGGQRIEMVIRPDPGYRLKPGSLSYRDGSNTVVNFNGNETGFIMPRDTVSVYGEFEAINYTVNADNAIKNGTIKISPQQGIAGTTVKLEIIPENGYRLKPASLKYRSARGGGETAIDEKTWQFVLPPDNIIVMAQFEPYSALGNLMVNGRPVKGFKDGKTDYKVWIRRDEGKAEITFTPGAGISVEPGSGKSVNLEVLGKSSVAFSAKSQEGRLETAYTITVIREFISVKAVPKGAFSRDENGNNISVVSAFNMGEREITQAEWFKVMGFNRGTDGDAMPARKVSWYEAVMFCNKLSMLEEKDPVYVVRNSTDPAAWGTVPDLANRLTWYVSCRWDANGYRLPTEMEWHWAAMGADSGLSGKPNASGYKAAFAGASLAVMAGEAAWYTANSGGKIHRVGEKKANELGIYDLSGNVMEWCWDWVNHNNLKNYGLSGFHTDFRGGDNNIRNKMRRGGCYLSEKVNLVLNYRGNESGPQTEPAADGDPRINNDYVGLRIVHRN